MNSATERKNTPNYYLALDITPGASHNEILHAYNRSKTTYANGSLASYGLFEGDSSVSILDEIEEAFAVLGNPSRRREYDVKMGFQSWTDESAAPKAAAASPSVVSTIKQSAKPADGAAPAGGGASPAKGGGSLFAAKRATAAAKPAARPNFEPNPDFEKQIEECKQLDGAFIKAVRIYRQMSVDELAQRCKLSASHVEAIENEDGSALHQPVYLRGHVYLICQQLELPDVHALAQSYIERIRALGKLPKTPF